jgi:DNA-directed RNA polymerase subunit RPC12/RpoP
MHVLGADASRCHQYDVSNAKVKRTNTYAYVCSRCSKEFDLGPKRHAKAQRGVKYWHPNCGSANYPLVPATAQKQPVATVHVRPQTTPVQPAAGSKFDQCLKIYNTNKDRLFKQDMIDLFINNVGCTPAGASTYYYKCKAVA